MRGKVLIAGYFGFGNTGDEAILAAMLDALLRLDPAIVATVVSADPAETAARHGVESIGWTRIGDIVGAAAGSDLIVLGGGGLFHDYWGVNPDSILTPAHTGISFYAGFPLLATLLDKPLMLYGVGVGPLLTEQGRTATRVACEQADIVTVRDVESQSLLERIGVEPERIRVSADPAFAMAPAAPGRAQQILAAQGVPPDRRALLGVALRHWDFGVDPARWEREVALALDRFCDEHEATIIFLPFQELANALVDDGAVAGRVAQQMRHAERCVVLRGRCSAPEQAALVGACDLILGMRLHALIFAAIGGTPAVAIAYDPKVRNVMARLECAEYVLEPAAMTAQQLAGLLDLAYRRRAGIGIQLGAHARALAEAARENARLAIDLLHRGAPARRVPTAGTIDLLRRVALLRSGELAAANAHAEAQAQSLAALARQLDGQEHAAGQLREHLAASERAVQSQRLQLAETEQARALAAAQLDERRAHADALAGELSDTRQLLAGLAAQLDERQARVDTLTGRLSEQQQSLAPLTAQLGEREIEVRTLQATVADRDEGIAWQRAELELAREVTAERDRAIDWLRAELDQAGRELARLRASVPVRFGKRLRVLRGRLRAAIPAPGPDARRRQRLHWRLHDRVRHAIGTRLPTPAKRWLKALLGSQGSRASPVGDRVVAGAAPPAPDRVVVDAAPPAPEAPPDFYRSLDIMPGISQESVAQIIGRAAADVVPRRADVICFSIIDWEFRYQRPQQMMSQFAAQGHRVFWLSPSRFLAADAAPPYTITRIRDNIHEVTLAVDGVPDVYGEVFDGAKQSSLLAALGELRRACGIDEAVGYVMIASWAGVALEAQQRWGWSVLYDCMDEWENFPGVKPAILAAERRLVREADLLVVTAQRLWDKWQSASRPMVLARNAVDYEFYARRCVPNTLLTDLRHPVVGYYGAIADWFDIELMTNLARQRPAYSFVLLGGVFDVDVSALAALPNVRLLGQQPYETMPQYLHHFDACIIPFKVNPITEATDPVKLYEYLAGGKPVVSVPLAELTPYRDHIYLARDRDDFPARLDAALAEDSSELAARRRELARGHTWSERYRTVARGLAEVTPRASVVIVTYGNLALTRLCLESVLRNTEYPDYEVIVVDNASDDATPVYLRSLADRHPNVEVILNRENLGFARANNQGIARSTGAYLVLLNNDTIVPPGWLTRLLRHLADPQVGLVGPVTNFVGNEARIEVPYRSWAQMEAFAAEFTRARAGQVADIHMLAMFCVALRRATYDEIGPLDEQFGVGMFEDDDYSQRVKLRGYRVLCAADAFVHHFGQAAFKDLIARGEYDELFRTNLRLYESKWQLKWVLHKHAELEFGPHFGGGKLGARPRPDATVAASGEDPRRRARASTGD